MAVITAEEIRQLASFRSAEAPVTTCYLDVDGARFVRPVDVEAELERVLRGAGRTGPTTARWPTT